MPRRVLLIVSATALLLCASAAFAWNAAGHMAIASIAYDELNDYQRSALVTLLKEHPRFHQDFQDRFPASLEGDALDRWIFMHAATWPDIARGLKGEDQKAYNRPMWHFIDLPVYLDETARQRIHPPSMKTDYHKASSELSMNVVQALNKAMADLNDPQISPASKAIALCWVLHLAGDIHQPLHGATLYSAARFRGVPFGDRGGNSNGTNAYAINASGQVVGSSQTISGDTHAFLYSTPGIIDLGTLGGDSSEALGINASGQIVGYGNIANGTVHAFIYSDGTMKT
jgi:probable HAF family extracellular repeat protein